LRASIVEMIIDARRDSFGERIQLAIGDLLAVGSLDQLEDLHSTEFQWWLCDDVHMDVMESCELSQKHDVRLGDSEFVLERARRGRDQTAEATGFGGCQRPERLDVPSQDKDKPANPGRVECVCDTPHAVVIDALARRQRQIGVSLAGVAALLMIAGHRLRLNLYANLEASMTRMPRDAARA